MSTIEQNSNKGKGTFYSPMQEREFEFSKSELISIENKYMRERDWQNIVTEISNSEKINTIIMSGINIANRHILRILENSLTVTSQKLRLHRSLIMTFSLLAFPVSRFQLPAFRRNRVWEEQPDLRTKRKELSSSTSAAF